MLEINKGALVWVLVCLIASVAAASAGAAVERTLSDRIEMLDWSDPERAAQFIDAAPRARPNEVPDVRMLEVRGMVYADVHRDADVAATLANLEQLARRGHPDAAVAAHYVRAYSDYQNDRYAAASTELKDVDFTAVASVTERYRLWLLRGNAWRMLGEMETALPFLEKALDLAHEMHDDLRTLHAMLWLARIFTNTGNFERASLLLDSSRTLATKLGDEAALVEVEGCVSDVADRQGDRAGERRASLAALEHAKLSGSSKWLAHALINLGDSYLKTRDFGESLKYSKEAAPWIMKLHMSGDFAVMLFNQGLAHIGLGNIRQGEKLASGAIDQALAGNNLLDAQDMLHEYADALEHAGYLMMAIQAYHRYDDIGEKVMSAARQRAFLEVSAKFDDERRARELELLRRDNELKAAEMNAQRLHQQLILVATLFIACICAALCWAFTRVRKANDRLRLNSERDALTGLFNRRYFNERMLGTDVSRPFSGCVLLADLDFFKRINDTWGHPAGDFVLAAVSRRLAETLRKNDTLVRWGGEEFLAVLEPVTAEQADAMVERLLAEVRREPVLWQGRPIECTMSIGYACFPLTGAAAPLCLNSAISLIDQALYEAKRRGRDRACVIRTLAADSPPTRRGENVAVPADNLLTVVEMGVAA